jgi:hypothetical protein
MATKPDKMCFLNTCPLDGDAAFKEHKPTDSILALDSFKETWPYHMNDRKRFRAVPFSKSLNDPESYFIRGGMNRSQPSAKQGHKQSPYKVDSWFLTKPHMLSIFRQSTAWAI